MIRWLRPRPKPSSGPSPEPSPEPSEQETPPTTAPGEVRAGGERAVAAGGGIETALTGSDITYIRRQVVNVQGPPEPVRPRDRAEPLQIGLVPAVADAFQERGLRRFPGADTGIRSSTATGTGGADGSAGAACHVLTGMGGVGKSQLAARHAHRLLREGALDLVVWVNATSSQEILKAYRAAARATVDTDPAGPADPEAFLAWLNTTGRRWLIVLDDLRDPADMRGLWPPERGNGQVVVTTRSRVPALRTSTRRLVEVGPFDPEQSAAYLVRRFETHGMPQPPAELAALADELGHLPLALAQAASFVTDLADTGMTAARYRQLLGERRPLSELAPEPGALPDDQEATLDAVLGLSLEHADRRTGGLATPVLQFLSLLDPSGVPAGIFTSWRAQSYLTVARGGPDASSRMVDDGAVRTALRTLNRLSLVNLSPRRLPTGTPGEDGGDLIAVHALTQRAAYDTVPPQWRGWLARAAGGALFHAWPEQGCDLDLAAILLSSAVLLQSAAAQDELWDPDYEPDFLLLAGQSLGELGQAAAAVRHFEGLRSAAERHYGPDDPFTLSARAARAFWRGQAGDPAGAARDFAGLLPDRIRVLGPDHPDTLVARQNHARCLGESGDEYEAFRLLEELLPEQLAAVGADDPQVFTTRNLLASWAEDEYEALDLNLELLADEVRVLGRDHPHVLTTLANIAHHTRRLGTPEEAVAAFEALHEAQSRALGPGHPDLLDTRSELALLAGDLPAASTALDELLVHRLDTLGGDHPLTLATRHKAIGLRARLPTPPHSTVAAYQDLLHDIRRVRGPDHPDTLITRHDLAHTRHEAGDTRGAVAELRELLDHIRGISTPLHVLVGVLCTLKKLEDLENLADLEDLEDKASAGAS
ncbi:tetratricopeptide repeat protein [Kitasatospora sp. NPDC058170]|uniref:tetratricopeptide repeat protein n=1 Tax=Kitasatospora sp. NPDC058170 TaxID=3346364 RepID=UPI0036DF0BAA